MKYYNYELIKFLKHDAKKIKYLTPQLKNSEILNLLSRYFGWRHFNELSKKVSGKQNFIIDNKNISLLSFSSMSFKELNEFKENYKNYLKDKLYLTQNDINKLNSLFLKIKYEKLIYINNNKYKDFEIDLNDYYIKLNNQEIKDLFLRLLKLENSMWVRRAFLLFKDIRKMVLNIEGKNINYQEYLRYFISGENLIKYIKRKKIAIKDIREKYKAIYANPLIEKVLEPNSSFDKNRSFYENYAYLSMQIMIKPFTEKDPENKIEITLDDLRDKINNNKDKNIIIYHAKDCNYNLMNSFLKKQLLGKPKYYGKRKKEEINKIMDIYKKKYDKLEIWSKIFFSLMEALPKNLFFSALEGNENSIKILSDLDYIYENALRSDNKKLINRLEFIPGFNKNINNQNKTAKEQYDIQIRPFLEYVKENNI
tara:strand:- start:29772 stop:31043 length:1272 start_codon:yes stop_codon:yes gene_type:complete